MREASALARIKARLFGWKANTLPELEMQITVENRCLRRLRQLQKEVSMRPRSCGHGSATPMATRRGPITENKTRGNVKEFRRHGSNPLPLGRKAPAAPTHKTSKPVMPHKVDLSGTFTEVRQRIEPDPQKWPKDPAGPRPAIRGSVDKVPGMMTEAEIHERCEYVVGTVQCCLERDHNDRHLFKCAGDYCPGLPWVASNTPHPTSCAIDFVAVDD